MSRIALAFSAFFRILVGKPLTTGVAPFLPPELKALPAGAEPTLEHTTKVELTGRPIEARFDGAASPGAAPKPDVRPEVRADVREPAREDRPKKVDLAAHHRDGALALLALLQREGRLIDFARESLDGFGDADIGAAARDVHRGVKKVLDQCFTFEAVMPGEEDARVNVPRGFDPAEVRLIGEARGEPPFGGTLRHHGWRATRTQLPSLTEGLDRAVVAPAEVEVS